MEDGWTVCSAGFGIVSLENSGQPDESHAEEMLKKLEELAKIPGQEDIVGRSHYKFKVLG